MSAERIAEIRARHQVIPQEPWRDVVDDEGQLQVVIRPDWSIYIEDMEISAKVDHDVAAFIANAPADVGWLLAEVERLQAGLEECRLNSMGPIL